MLLSRVLRGTLPVLLLWPMLSSLVMLSSAPMSGRGMHAMACCARPSGETCGHCEANAHTSCAMDGASRGACILGTSPCHRTAPTPLTPFAWDPFVTDPGLDARHEERGTGIRPAPIQGAAMRAIPTRERPPAA